MALVLLIGSAPLVLLLTLAALLYLTWFELRGLGLPRTRQLWWYLLVFLLHAPAYLALRIWAYRRAAAAREAA